MTIPTDISSQIFLGNGATSVFTCNFVPGASDGSNIEVSLSAGSTVPQIVASSLYTLAIGAPATGAIWPTSFTLTYPLSGPPISTGMTLTVARLLPFTQDTAFSNQGNLWPQAVETSDDTLAMQIQQLAARTTQFRSTWKTATAYSYGDIVQDGAAGKGTNNYYICQVPNTSGVWATDLNNGDWTLSVTSVVPVTNQPITLSGDVSGTGQIAITTTIGANAVTNAKLAKMAANTIKGNNTAGTANVADLTIDQVFAMLSLTSMPPQGRLTLSSTLPVLTADATAQATVYYLPYAGQMLPVYDGTQFVYWLLGSSGLSLALDSNSGHTGYQQSGKNFDLYAFLNSGVLTLATGPAWDSDTSRASNPISQQGGLWVNTNSIVVKTDATAATVSVSANQSTYLGTMRATANGQTGMAFLPASASGGSNAILGLYNAYNRVRATSRSQDSTASWTYGTNTWRAAASSSNNRISWVDGLQQSFVEANYSVCASQAGSVNGNVGVTLDATTGSPSTGIQAEISSTSGTISYNAPGNINPQLGFHFAQAMELAGAATVTWSGAGLQALRISLEM